MPAVTASAEVVPDVGLVSLRKAYGDVAAVDDDRSGRDLGPPHRRERDHDSTLRPEE